jgi:hypothetical protein
MIKDVIMRDMAHQTWGGHVGSIRRSERPTACAALPCRLALSVNGHDGSSRIFAPNVGFSRVPVSLLNPEGKLLIFYGSLGGNRVVMVPKFAGDRSMFRWLYPKDGGPKEHLPIIATVLRHRAVHLVNGASKGKRGGREIPMAKDLRQALIELQRSNQPLLKIGSFSANAISAIHRRLW